ncbi:hypothetical protein [uncultured Adlercreutzia sp.]|jgi:hypothetical protein|uniref:hypothetical protein n=1 Tax=uncultured Adlercreutzia sp. TaxID=875803 RepID=UPI0025E1DC70|nr:hypothetical protein [uncultured Adlercreutzia sp.]
MTDYTDSRPVLAVLAETGLPCAYRQWHPAAAPPLPYLVVVRASREDVMADDSNYLKLARWRAELYSEGADLESMAAVEAALESHGIAYSAFEGGGGDAGVPLAATYYFDMLGAS